MLRDTEGEPSLLVTLRHDVSCSTCNNLQVAVHVGLDDWKIRSVYPLEPWELSGKSMDPTPFLSQFSGRLAGERTVVGENIDGITGATLTVNAFLHELQVLGQWRNDAKSLASAG